jgi:hypothetical protein
MNAEEFRALTERIAALERRIEAEHDRVTVALQAEEVLRRATMPEGIRRVAEQESRREVRTSRHLRAVD